MTDIVATATVPAAPADAQPAGNAHNLADLQAEALAQYGMTPADTLAAAHRLYARNQISDPNTEERRLPEYMFDEAASIIQSYTMVSGSRLHDPEYQAPCWVRHVLDYHMGIMLRAVPAAALFGVAMSEPETRIYSLVHARFLSLFVRPTP